MTTEPTNQPAASNALPNVTMPPVVWGRPLAIIAAVAMFISWMFPAIAGFVRDTKSWPKWWGVLDVSLAFLLAILAFAVLAVAQGRVSEQAENASYRAYWVLLHGIFAILVVFFLVGYRIIWPNCLSGFAWRFWLLLYCLPAWITVFGSSHGRRL